MEIIKLRNGKEVPEALVKVLLTSVTILVQNQPIVLYELVMLCRDRSHKLFGNAETVLRGLALIESNGQPHDVTRDIILAMAEGDGLDLRIVDPRAKN